MSKTAFDINIALAYVQSMATHAFTLRLPTQERQALENLSRVEGRPMNQILNDAIKAYLHRQSEEERQLEESLGKLRAYRERDPEFRAAIAAVAHAEVSTKDPLEGTIVRHQPSLSQPARAKRSKLKQSAAEPPSGPLQQRLRDMLNA